MTWILVLTSLATLIYLYYNVVALAKFNVPHSLSETYYLYGETEKPKMKHQFTIMMVSMAMLLMPAWLDISEGSNFQFTAFLAACGIIFTGLIPEFKKSKFEKTAHTVCALVAAAAAIAWVILVAQIWWVIVIYFFFVALFALLTSSYKTSITFWLETIAFLSTFTAIFVHYLR